MTRVHGPSEIGINLTLPSGKQELKPHVLRTDICANQPIAKDPAV